MTDATAQPQQQAVARVTPSEGEVYARRAVLYLRVSSLGQVNTDRDGEGFSIAAQRDACIRKAESLGAMVVETYIDAAESARRSDRPELQAMLQLRTDSAYST